MAWNSPLRATRIAVMALLPALVAGQILGGPAAAADADDAVAAWLAALASNDTVAIAAVLAPEFQVQRLDGRGFTRDEYLASGQTTLAKPPAARDLVATEADGVLVVRYVLDIEQQIDGRTVVGASPRLTVFRKVGERWLAVAHAAYPAVR